MNKKTAIDYLCRVKECSIADFQKEFAVDYGEARKLFRELESGGLLKYDGGLKFVYCGVDRNTTKSANFLFNLKVEFARLPSVVSKIALEYAVNGRDRKISVFDIAHRLGEEFSTALEVYGELQRLRLIGQDDLINISAEDCKKALE